MSLKRWFSRWKIVLSLGAILFCHTVSASPVIITPGSSVELTPDKTTIVQCVGTTGTRYCRCVQEGDRDAAMKLYRINETTGKAELVDEIDRFTGPWVPPTKVGNTYYSGYYDIEAALSSCRASASKKSICQ